jgi:CelD/BcsL family acetyltransferase involved in cellulose biosynthesis
MLIRQTFAYGSFSRRLETVDGSEIMSKLKQTNGEGSSPPHAYLVQREDHLDFIGDEYHALYDRASASAFQSGRWLNNLYRDLAPARGAVPCVITLRSADQGRLVGVLPLICRRRAFVRLIEYADLGVSDYAMPVLDRNHDRQIRSDPSLPARVRAALGEFDLLLVERVVDDAALISELIHGARSTQHSYGAHLASLDFDVETWHGRLDPSFNRRLTKSYKRLGSRGGANFRVVDNLEEVAGICDALRKFRSVRFTERGGIDLFQDPDYYTFYKKVAQDSLTSSGPGRLNVLEVGGQPAAIALDLVDSDRELFLIVGYDLKRLRNLSLGLLIVDQIAHAAIACGLRYLDLTVGDELYKSDFGAIRRPLFHVRVTRTPLGYIAFHGHELYLRIRRTAKRTVILGEKYQKQRQTLRAASGGQTHGHKQGGRKRGIRKGPN